MRDKKQIEEKAQKLVEMTSGFCKERLDEDYEGLCKKLILKMSRKRNVPFLTGRLNIWAAAVVYSLGQINFLFDKQTKPYVNADDICGYFKTSRTTTSQKAKKIRDMFKMTYWDAEFSRQQMMDDNPYAKFAMVDGFIVSVDDLPEP
ncbi:MAG: DUF6398 domain-containing protein [Candidatus Eremiobacteraeota bacterium]|nr:DUF6398 domain-containing protein [Candidatus Eremiobacteraeota bacterium]